MSIRSNGGYIGPRPAGPSIAAAAGVWDLRTCEQNKRAGVWPTTQFFPTSIANLGVWFDASDSLTLFDATTGGSFVAAGGAVARWEDKSGNGRHATQATSTKRPLRSTASVNGRDALLFDGSTDKLVYSGPAQSDATIFAVVRQISGGSAYQGVFAYAKTYCIYSRLMNSGQWGLYNVNSSSDNASGVSLTAGVTFVLTARRTSSNRFLYTNGTLSATVAADSYSGYIDVIGADDDNTQVQNGRICELIGYSRSLTDSERGEVETYLISKWGA